VEKGIQQAIEAAVKALQEEIRYLSDENLLLRKELERVRETFVYSCNARVCGVPKDR
jgi:FtsZ-binding cell division protein ZapB